MQEAEAGGRLGNGGWRGLGGQCRTGSWGTAPPAPGAQEAAPGAAGFSHAADSGSWGDVLLQK